MQPLICRSGALRSSPLHRKMFLSLGVCAAATAADSSNITAAVTARARAGQESDGRSTPPTNLDIDIVRVAEFRFGGVCDLLFALLG